MDTLFFVCLQGIPYTQNSDFISFYVSFDRYRVIILIGLANSILQLLKKIFPAMRVIYIDYSSYPIIFRNFPPHTL